MGKPFARAAKAVETWLDTDGAPYAKRAVVKGSSRSILSWDLDLGHPALLAGSARLSLPRDFPATPAQMYVDKRLLLVIPHVEETGRVCLGVQPSAYDYDYPIGAVERVIQAFQDFLSNCLDPDWVRNELQRERLAYWLRFCEGRSHSLGARPTPARTYVAFDSLTGREKGTVAIYFGHGKNPRALLAVGCAGTADPHVLARRHGLAAGTLVRGSALFVPMPDSKEWTPSEWPVDFAGLEFLVNEVSGGQQSLLAWIEEQRDEKSRPFLVFLVQGQFVYGYHLFPPVVRGCTSPTIEPMVVGRIDPSWSLTRDHASTIFTTRRSKRVLVLGCGSLGSPVVELLARAGVGQMVVVDQDVFLPENCSRHVLGLSAAHSSKAVKLAERLTREIPGVEVKGRAAPASSWIAECVKPNEFDAVVDCTGEGVVRALLSRHRDASLGTIPVVHAWLEPFCAAAHVVLLNEFDSWPLDDPADDAVNAAAWPVDTKVKLPACSAGFHPYGAADAWQAAGFAAERILSVLDGHVSDSTIWSWVRSKAFFDELGVDAQPRDVVPIHGSRFDAVMLTRDFREVIGRHE